MTNSNILCADVIRAALAQMKPRPSVEMYPGDWLRDAISGCSLAANGLWWRMTMVMHDAKPYGHMVANNGLPMPEQQMAQRCGARSLAEWRKVLAELEAAGIPGRTGDEEYRKILNHEPIEIRQSFWTLDLSPLAIEQTGILYSRRMLRDRILSLVRFFVSPKGQSLIPSLSEGLSSQTPEFVRDARARSAEGEEEVGSLSQPTKTGERVQGEGKPLTPQQTAVGMVLDAFDPELRPAAGLAARWISLMAEGRRDPNPIPAAEAVREIVWKYPTKGPEYIAKCVLSAATRATTEPKENHGTERSFGRPPVRKPAPVTLVRPK